MHDDVVAYMEKPWLKYEVMMQMVIDAIERIQDEVFIDDSQSWPDWQEDIIKDGEDFIQIVDSFEQYKIRLESTKTEMQRLKAFLTGIRPCDF